MAFPMPSKSQLHLAECGASQEASSKLSFPLAAEWPLVSVSGGDGWTDGGAWAFLQVQSGQLFSAPAERGWAGDLASDLCFNLYL